MVWPSRIAPWPRSTSVLPSDTTSGLPTVWYPDIVASSVLLVARAARSSAIEPKLMDVPCAGTRRSAAATRKEARVEEDTASINPPQELGPSSEELAALEAAAGKGSNAARTVLGKIKTQGKDAGALGEMLADALARAKHPRRAPRQPHAAGGDRGGAR